MDTNITIVGGGVIGLAIASELPLGERRVLIERNNTYGRETSSRNSEVIHSAVNYPPNSLKSKLCLEGNKLLYSLLSTPGLDISYKKIGKLIIIQSKSQEDDLEFKFLNAKESGLDDICILSEKEIKKLEPNVRALSAIYSKNTGIINAHSFINYLFKKSKQNNVDFLFNHEVINVERVSGGYELELINNDEKYSFTTEVLINAAGLDAHKISEKLGFNHRQYYCKGDYFSVHNGKNKLISRLIYPLIGKNSPGLGVHITLGLDGRMRLGPDVTYVDEINYQVNENKKRSFYEFVKPFFPALELEDLQPDISGIRPKLQGPGDGFKDFHIRQDLPNFVNLLGIESPGLTSSLAIAKYVKELVFN